MKKSFREDVPKEASTAKSKKGNSERSQNSVFRKETASDGIRKQNKLLRRNFKRVF